MDGDKFNCHRCRSNRHCDDTGAWRPAGAAADWGGSNGPAPYPIQAIEGVIESRTCFLPMITPLSHFMFKLYGHYKAGQLLSPGGILEQPAAYVQAIDVIQSQLNQIEREQIEKARRG